MFILIISLNPFHGKYMFEMQSLILYKASTACISQNSLEYLLPNPTLFQRRYRDWVVSKNS